MKKGNIQSLSFLQCLNKTKCLGSYSKKKNLTWKPHTAQLKKKKILTATQHNEIIIKIMGQY